METFFNQFSFVTWTCLATLLVTAFQYWRKRPHPRFPPGPRGFPVVGVFPYMKYHRKLPHEMFKKWSLERYGDVMSVRMGSRDVVVLNTYESISEALLQQPKAFSGGAELEVFKQVATYYGILHRYDDAYKENRNFGIQALNGVFRKNKMDVILTTEANRLMEKIRKQNGKPIAITSILYKAAGNVISTVLLSKRYEDDNVPFNRFLDIMHDILIHPKFSRNVLMLVSFWNLRFLPHLRKANDQMIAYINELIDLVQIFLDERKVRLEANDDEAWDYVGAYLREMKQAANNNNPYLCEKQLNLCTRDLLVAGTETTSSQLSWAIICLLNYPQYHQPIVDEIISVLGKSTPLSDSRNEDFPLTNAFLQEVLRYRPADPVGRHKTTVTTEFRGYLIPKGTSVALNLYGALWDPKLWPNPEKFYPGRHLNEEGRFIFSRKIIAFGIGPRFCVGEKLARREFFFFFVELLRNFKLEGNGGIPSMNPSSANIVLSPDKFEVRLTERK